MLSPPSARIWSRSSGQSSFRTRTSWTSWTSWTLSKRTRRSGAQDPPSRETRLPSSSSRSTLLESDRQPPLLLSSKAPPFSRSRDRRLPLWDCLSNLTSSPPFRPCEAREPEPLWRVRDRPERRTTCREWIGRWRSEGCRIGRWGIRPRRAAHRERLGRVELGGGRRQGEEWEEGEVGGGAQGLR